MKKDEDICERCHGGVDLSWFLDLELNWLP